MIHAEEVGGFGGLFGGLVAKGDVVEAVLFLGVRECVCARVCVRGRVLGEMVVCMYAYVCSDLCVCVYIWICTYR